MDPNKVLHEGNRHSNDDGQKHVSSDPERPTGSYRRRVRPACRFDVSGSNDRHDRLLQSGEVDMGQGEHDAKYVFSLTKSQDLPITRGIALTGGTGGAG